MQSPAERKCKETEIEIENEFEALDGERFYGQAPTVPQLNRWCCWEINSATVGYYYCMLFYFDADSPPPQRLYSFSTIYTTK